VACAGEVVGRETRRMITAAKVHVPIDDSFVFFIELFPFRDAMVHIASMTFVFVEPARAIDSSVSLIHADLGAVLALFLHCREKFPPFGDE